MNSEPQDSTVQRSTEPETDERIPGLKWVVRNWARTRLGHEGVMLDRVQRVQRISEVLARNTMTGNMADTTGLPNGSEGDGMGVDIGDSVVNHHYYANPEQPQVTPPKKPMGPLAKAAIAAALVGTGAGGALAVPWLMGMFNQPPPAVETPVDTMQQIVVE